MRALWIAMALIVLTACGKTPVEPVIIRPEWRSAAVEGIAPLMSPNEVDVALARNGYEQVACPTNGKVFARPLYVGDNRSCYRSPTRTMSVSLYFLELNEGRRLAVVNFHQVETAGSTDAERLAASGALARRLRARFGKPSGVIDASPRYRSFSWNRPGGRPDLPDTIRTTMGRDFSPEITMTSMWAYGELRPAP